MPNRFWENKIFHEFYSYYWYSNLNNRVHKLISDLNLHRYSVFAPKNANCISVFVFVCLCVIELDPKKAKRNENYFWHSTDEISCIYYKEKSPLKKSLTSFAKCRQLVSFWRCWCNCHAIRRWSEWVTVAYGVLTHNQNWNVLDKSLTESCIRACVRVTCCCGRRLHLFDLQQISTD